MTDTVISERAKFDQIRYAQLWEDADILVAALGDIRGKTAVSICSAGDNTLALLLGDPEHVIAVDLSEAQLNCLKLRLAAMKNLDHSEFLELMGARPSQRRGKLLGRALQDAPQDLQEFWQARSDDIEANGAGGAGKFERYFRIFSRYLLPLVHSRKTVADIFVHRTPEARAEFFDKRFNTWRWKLLVKLFFSRFAMGRMGRDKAFFDHVEGSVADHVFSRLRHAGVATDPSENPYLHWIMTATHGAALPLPWRKEAFEIIRTRLGRIKIHQGPLEALDITSAAAFNLSDIFEYMSQDIMASAYGDILSKAAPGARMVYWNMMAPRRCPAIYTDRITTQTALEDDLKARDKAFFYSDLVVEEVI